MDGIDPANPIVQLLGRAASREHVDPEGAAAAYRRAWDEASDDYEACMAAHYMARIQPSAEERYQWNAVALERATAVGSERVTGFLPSLHLNLARSLEDLGRLEDARNAYAAAASALAKLEEGAYRSSIQDALRRARERIGQ